MKKLGVLLVVLLFTTGITYSQERGGGDRPSKTMGPGQGNRGNRPQMSPEQMLQRQTQRLVEELKLNKEQEAKVLAINKKYQEKQPFDFPRCAMPATKNAQKCLKTCEKFRPKKTRKSGLY